MAGVAQAAPAFFLRRNRRRCCDSYIFVSGWNRGQPQNEVRLRKSGLWSIASYFMAGSGSLDRVAAHEG